MAGLRAHHRGFRIALEGEAALDLLIGFAKTAHALGIPVDGGLQLVVIELRPQDLAEVQLGVGTLPNQKVAQARLATRADEQIRLGQGVGAQIGLQTFRGQLLQGLVGVGVLPSAGGLQNVPAPTVVDRHRQVHHRALGGQALAQIDLFLELRGKGRLVANDPQADALLLQLGDLGLQITHKEIKEGGHFLGRTSPVLGAEGKDREVLDLFLHARLHHRSQIGRPHQVAHATGHETLFGPASIAVHDDNDVIGV